MLNKIKENKKYIIVISVLLLIIGATILYFQTIDLRRMYPLESLAVMKNWDENLDMEDLCNEKYSQEMYDLGTYMINSYDVFSNSNNSDTILEFEKHKDEFLLYKQLGEKLQVISRELKEFDYTTAQVHVDELISFLKENGNVFIN